MESYNGSTGVRPPSADTGADTGRRSLAAMLAWCCCFPRWCFARIICRRGRVREVIGAEGQGRCAGACVLRWKRAMPSSVWRVMATWDHTHMMVARDHRWHPLATQPRRALAPREADGRHMAWHPTREVADGVPEASLPLVGLHRPHAVSRHPTVRPAVHLFHHRSPQHACVRAVERGRRRHWPATPTAKTEHSLEHDAQGRCITQAPCLASFRPGASAARATTW